MSYFDPSYFDPAYFDTGAAPVIIPDFRGAYVPRRERQFVEARGRVVAPSPSVSGRLTVTPTRYATLSLTGPRGSVSGRGRITPSKFIRQRLLEDRLLTSEL